MKTISTVLSEMCDAVDFSNWLRTKLKESKMLAKIYRK